MTNKDRCLYAYFGGLIDGEGSIYITKSKIQEGRGISYSMQIKVTMTDALPILMLQYFFPACFRCEQRVEGRREVYSWIILANKAYDFLSLIKPFLFVKHQQATLAMSFQAFKRRSWVEYQRKHAVRIRGNQKRSGFEYYPESYWRRSERFYQKMHQLNSNPLNGVNSVELLRSLDLRQYRSKPEDCERLLEGVETSIRKFSSQEKIYDEDEGKVSIDRNDIR